MRLLSTAAPAHPSCPWPSRSPPSSLSLMRGTQWPLSCQAPLSLTPPPGTLLSVTSLSPDTTYYFRVSAYGDGTTYTAEWSTASGTASAKTNQAPPATPTGLSSTAADGTIELTWTAVTGATAYVVHQWHGQTLKYIQLAFKDPTTDQQYTLNGSTILKSVSATTATIGGLTNGTSYTHQVRSKNSAGQSVTSHRVV